MSVIRIIALSVAAAVAYGVVHDQITARVCVEYFTIGHPPVFRTESPTLLGLGWGVIATWWVGLIVGVPLGLAARAGERRKLEARDLVRPIGILLWLMFCFALIAGVTGFLLSRRQAVWLLQPLAYQVPYERHHRFIACLWAHSASYIAGFVGGIVLVIRTWMRRRQEPV